MVKKAPKTISGVPVFQSGDPMKTHGEAWVTMVPEDDNDGRLWEFSLTTGRILLTREAS